MDTVKASVGIILGNCHEIFNTSYKMKLGNTCVKYMVILSILHLKTPTPQPTRVPLSCFSAYSGETQSHV